MLKRLIVLVVGVSVFLVGCTNSEEVPIGFVAVGGDSVLTLISGRKYEHHLNGVSVGFVELKKHENSVYTEEFKFEILESNPQSMTPGHVFKLKSVGYTNSPVLIPLTAFYMCESCHVTKTYLSLAYTKIISKSN